MSFLICLHTVFQHYYHGPILATTNSTFVLQQMTEILEKANNHTNIFENAKGNGTMLAHVESYVYLPESLVVCTRERPILCLLLMLGTLWFGYALYLLKRRYVHLFDCKMSYLFMLCNSWISLFFNKLRQQLSSY